VIDVEQHALRAFEQDPPAGARRLVEVTPYGARELQNGVGNLGKVRRAVDRGRSPAPRTLHASVMVSAQPVKQWIQIVEMGEVADPDRAASDLILIRRPNAAPCRADLAGARCVLAKRVKIAVIGRINGQVSAIISTSGVISTPCADNFSISP
jgi:hypothetical protein